VKPKLSLVGGKGTFRKGLTTLELTARLAAGLVIVPVELLRMTE
jgi:hypothetical protein